MAQRIREKEEQDRINSKTWAQQMQQDRDNLEIKIERQRKIRDERLNQVL